MPKEKAAIGAFCLSWIDCLLMNAIDMTSFLTLMGTYLAIFVFFFSDSVGIELETFVMYDEIRINNKT